MIQAGRVNNPYQYEHYTMYSVHTGTEYFNLLICFSPAAEGDRNERVHGQVRLDTLRQRRYQGYKDLLSGP